MQGKKEQTATRQAIILVMLFYAYFILLLATR